MRISVQGISKQFEDKSGKVSVLENISFTTEEREFLCILGPSGCGKTTLLRIIAGLLAPSSGKVVYEGNQNERHHGISLVFQERGVFPWMNVIDNICFGLEMQGVSRKKRYEMVLPLIVRLGLSGFEKHYPHQLSVGMKQRVGLTRALVNRTEILLMDEPFAALDAQMRLISQEQMLEICRDYNKQVIYVTHDIDEALLLADRILLLTARPSKVKEQLVVDAPKPRVIGGTNDGTLLAMKQAIWKHLKEEVMKASSLKNEKV